MRGIIGMPDVYAMVSASEVACRTGCVIEPTTRYYWHDVFRERACLNCFPSINVEWALRAP